MTDIITLSAPEITGLEKSGIDGMFITTLPGIFDGYATSHFFTKQVSQYLGVKPKFTDLIDYGGASALTMVYKAYKTIRAGEAESVLCIVGGKASYLRSKGVPVDSVDRAYNNTVSITPFDKLFRGLKT